jgi:hypothetical protein
MVLHQASYGTLTARRTRVVRGGSIPMLGWTFSVAVGLHYYEIVPYLWTGVFEREFTRPLLRNRVSFRRKLQFGTLKG